MAYGDYYNPNNKVVTDGNIVYAEDLNSINTATDVGFQQVADDLQALEDNILDGGVSSRDWATEDQGVRPDPVEDLYSAKAYMLEAKGWANSTTTVTAASTGLPISGSVSAKTSANLAAGSASSAGSSAIAAGSARDIAVSARDTTTAARDIAVTARNEAVTAATNLPNATTAGANKTVVSDTAGTGWLYKTAVDMRTFIDSNNGSNITTGTIADARIANTIARLASPALTGTPTAPTAASGTNTTQVATTAFVIANGVPVGCVIPFMGGYFTNGSNGGFTNVLGNSVAAVNGAVSAAGYRVCDGAALNVTASPIFNGTGRYLPNLTDSRFLMGSTSAGGVGGGNTMAHTHTLVHTHTIAHVHGTSAHTLSTAQIPHHSHRMADYLVAGSGTSGRRAPGDSGGPAFTNTDGGGSSPSHSHGNTGGSSAANSGSASTTTTSGASNVENRPAFLACVYIMKVV